MKKLEKKMVIILLEDSIRVINELDIEIEDLEDAIEILKQENNKIRLDIVEKSTYLDEEK